VAPPSAAQALLELVAAAKVAEVGVRMALSKALVTAAVVAAAMIPHCFCTEARSEMAPATAATTTVAVHQTWLCLGVDGLDGNETTGGVCIAFDMKLCTARIVSLVSIILGC
jgi:hypothetical protein